METWASPEQALDAITRLHNKVEQDVDLMKGMMKVNQLIFYDYTQDGEDCGFWVDCRAGKFTYGSGRPAETPDLVMTLNLDDAHRAWSNKLNVVQAITRRKIKVKGSATGLLKLVPKQKKVAALYNQVLTEMGLADMIIS